MEQRVGSPAPGPRRRARILTTVALLACSALAVLWWQALPVQQAAASEAPGVEQWRAQLGAQQPLQRAQAVLALAQAQDRTSLEPLRTLLASDPAPNVRAAAALALADWQDRASTAAIVQLLQPSAGVGADVVLDALGRMGDTQAALAVLPYLDAEDDVLRLQAVQALVAMQAAHLGPRILQQAQGPHDPAKAKTYAMVLGKLQVRAAQDYLLDLARHSEPSPTRWASYLALGRIRSEAAVDLLADALAAPHDKGRENAQQALVAIGSARAAPRLWPLLAHAERSVRFAAADVLVGLDHPRSNAELLRALQRPPAQAAAALALGRRKVAAALEPVQAVLADPAQTDREVLAQALGWLGDARAVLLLRQVLAEPAGDGRWGAAWSLGVLQAREAREDLQQAAASADNRLAQLALDALGQLADPASADFLARQSQANPAQALGALASLALIPGDAARWHLQRLAAHEDARIGRAALQALAQRKDAAAVPTLLELLDKAPVDNRKAVQHALVSTTGQHWNTPQQWRQWYGTLAR
ncbi:MAG: HEAT repeat domain-containing protein [Rhodoferax sp.]